MFLLLLCERIPHIGILGNHIGQLELERVFADQIIIHSHFKGGPYHTLQNADGILLDSFIMQKNEPAFRIGELYGLDRLLPEWVRMDSVDC